MTKNNFYSSSLRLRVIATVILTLTLATFPARSNQAIAQTPSQKTPAPAHESTGGQKEGIKVHGHWTIEVRNPDGTLVKHHEFQNALHAFGAVRLSDVLARRFSFGLWTIYYSGLTLQDETCADVGGGTACTLAETTSQVNAQPNVFKTLVVSVPTNGPNSGKFVMSGNATAQRAGNVHRVQTAYRVCTSNVTPANCNDLTYGEGGPFTEATLAQPISIAAGQIVQVTVVISFS